MIHKTKRRWYTQENSGITSEYSYRLFFNYFSYNTKKKWKKMNHWHECLVLLIFTSPFVFHWRPRSKFMQLVFVGQVSYLSLLLRARCTRVWFSCDVLKVRTSSTASRMDIELDFDDMMCICSLSQRLLRWRSVANTLVSIKPGAGSFP